MPLADYEELNTTALKIDQGDWARDTLIASGAGGIRFKTILGPDYGAYTWRVATDKSIPGDGYGLTINSLSRFDYYLDFFQRYTTGDTDVFVIDFRGKKWTVGLSDTKFPFTKVRLMSELFGTQGVQLEYVRVIGETDYLSDGSFGTPGMMVDGSGFSIVDDSGFGIEAFTG